MIMQQGKIGFDRRQFLKHTALTTAGACTSLQKVNGIEYGNSPSIKNCIFLFLTGGPSQIDTFDPKPDAPAEIRGPFKSISSKVPGTFFAETLPLLAARADKFTLLRSLFHEEAPIHETGMQLMQTGRISTDLNCFPNYGSVCSALSFSSFSGTPKFAVLPSKIGSTGTVFDISTTLGEKFFSSTAYIHSELIIYSSNHTKEGIGSESANGTDTPLSRVIFCEGSIPIAL